MTCRLVWHEGRAGCWAVLHLRGLDLATLSATDRGWSIEGRDGKLEGAARSRQLAKLAAVRALEDMLAQAMSELRG